MERKWDSRMDRLGVRLEAPASAEYRLVETRWLGQAEAGDKHHIYVRVLDENGAPIENHPFRISNGGVRVERTKGRGFDDYYGNFPMFARGVYAVDIPDATSDKIVGLLSGLPENPYVNTCYYLIFQRGAQLAPPEPEPQPTPEPEPTPEPAPTPEPEPEPHPSLLDDETRTQLLALLDRAQAEIDAARALLEAG